MNGRNSPRARTNEGKSHLRNFFSLQSRLLDDILVFREERKKG
jgi:hypothetical protein